MVCLAGVKAIRYIGEAPKKLWEVGGRNVPILNKGDVVLVPALIGASLARNRFFEEVDGDISMKLPSLKAPKAAAVAVEEEKEPKPKGK